MTGAITDTDGWIKTDRGWIKSYGRARDPSPARSGLSCPGIVSDTMDLTEHVDGRFYDSKAAFRAVTKANGCIEVGNDPARLRPVQRPKANPRARRDAVQRAMAQAGLT